MLVHSFPVKKLAIAGFVADCFMEKYTVSPSDLRTLSICTLNKCLYPFIQTLQHL